MARPRKLQLEEEQEITNMDGDFGLKQVQRVISKMDRTNLETGYFSIADVDSYISGLLKDGWKLINTHYLGENPEGYIMWYILVKQ